MNDAPYLGLYINLDRSFERRKEIEAQLAAFGLAALYRRFAAVDGAAIAEPTLLTKGEVGCFRSHYEALRAGAAAGKPIHILEDDALLSEYVEGTLTTAIESGLLERFDILYTDTFMHADPASLTVYRAAFDRAVPRDGQIEALDFQLINLKRRGLACTSSYMVGKNSLERVMNVYKAELDRGPTVPPDLALRHAADTGELKIGCLFPFVTSVRLENIFNTTITGRENQNHNPAVMANALLRYSFFVGRDLGGYAKPFIEAALGVGPAGSGTHDELMNRVVEFVRSAQYKPF